MMRGVCFGFEGGHREDGLAVAGEVGTEEEGRWGREVLKRECKKHGSSLLPATCHV